MSQEFPTTTLYAEYQFHLEEIIDSMCRVYEKKYTNLKARGRDDKLAHRIAMKTAQQKLKLDLDELDSKFVDVRPKLQKIMENQFTEIID
jgi:hypothetical protein